MFVNIGVKIYVDKCVNKDVNLFECSAVIMCGFKCFIYSFIKRVHPDVLSDFVTLRTVLIAAEN